MSRTRTPSAGEVATATRGWAFGLDVSAAFAIPGIGPPAAGTLSPQPERSIGLEFASREELEDDWQPRAPRRISDRAYSSIDEDEHAGYRLWAEGYGLFRLSPDGRRGRCAPSPAAATWLWQRYLIGQLLPFSAQLQGLEGIHASAVAHQGRAIAVSGPPQAGKSTIAIELMRRGAGFLTDDVLCLETAGAGLTAYPGVGLTNVRHAAEPGKAEIGNAIGGDESATRFVVDRHGEPVPLGAVCFIERVPGTGVLELETPRPLDPRLVLACTFNFVLRDSERLERHLDVAARIAATTIVLRARVPATVGPSELADRLLETVEANWTQRA